MNEIKSIIVENDNDALKYLENIVSDNFTDIKIIGFAKSIDESIKLINLSKPELVFLDIELDDGEAFDILENVTHKDFEVIFTTGYNKYFEKALEHFAFYYLLKPIDLSMLHKVIKRYREVKQRMFNLNKYEHYKNFISEEDSRLLLHTGDRHIATKLSDIIYCEAEGNYTRFILRNDKSLLCSNTLKYYEDLFINKPFFRANRFSLVNIKQISSIYKKESLILSNDSKINVSVRNKSKLSDLISRLS